MSNSAGEHSHRCVPKRRVHIITTLQKLLVQLYCSDVVNSEHSHFCFFIFVLLLPVQLGPTIQFSRAMLPTHRAVSPAVLEQRYAY